jgi:hypothetical protein
MAIQVYTGLPPVPRVGPVGQQFSDMHHGRHQTTQMMMTKFHHLLTAKWKTLQMILTMKNLSLKLNLDLQYLDLELELQDMEPGG